MASYKELAGYIKSITPELQNEDDKLVAEYAVDQFPDQFKREEFDWNEPVQPGIASKPQVYLPKKIGGESPMSYTDQGVSYGVKDTEIKPASITPASIPKALSKGVGDVAAGITQSAASELSGNVQGVGENLDPDQQALYDLGKSVVESKKKNTSSYEKIAETFYKSRTAAPKIQETLQSKGKEFDALAQALREPSPDEQRAVEDARYFLKSKDALLPQNYLKTLNAAATVAAESGVTNATALVPGVGTALTAATGYGSEMGNWIDEAKSDGIDDPEILNTFGRMNGIISTAIETASAETLMAPLKNVIGGKIAKRKAAQLAAGPLKKEVAKRVLNGFAKGLGSFVVGSASEGAEEYSQSYVSDILKYLALTESAKKHPEKAKEYLAARSQINLKALDPEKLEAAYFGAIAGGVTRGATSGAAKVAEKFLPGETNAKEAGTGSPEVSRQEGSQGGAEGQVRLRDTEQNRKTSLSEAGITPEEFYTKIPDAEKESFFNGLNDSDQERVMNAVPENVSSEIASIEAQGQVAPEEATNTPSTEEAPVKPNTEGLAKKIDAAKNAQERQAVVDNASDAELAAIVRRGKYNLPEVSTKISKEEGEEVIGRSKEGEMLGGRKYKGGIERERKSNMLILDKNDDLEASGKKMAEGMEGVSYKGVQPGIRTATKKEAPRILFNDDYTGSTIAILPEDTKEALKKKIEDTRKADPEAAAKAIGGQLGLKFIEKRNIIGEAKGSGKYSTDSYYVFRTDKGRPVSIKPGDTVESVMKFLEKPAGSTGKEISTPTTEVKNEEKGRQGEALLNKAPETGRTIIKPNREDDKYLNRYIKSGDTESELAQQAHSGVLQIVNDSSVEDIADAAGIDIETAKAGVRDIKSNTDSESARKLREVFGPEVFYGRDPNEISDQIFVPRGSDGKPMFAKKKTTPQKVPVELIPKYQKMLRSSKGIVGPKKIYRGTSKTTGRRSATQGYGLYVTGSKEEARKYGNVEEVDISSIPKNPAYFRNYAEFNDLLTKIAIEAGVRRYSEITDNPADFLVAAGYDGAMFGSGKNASYVNYMDSKDIKSAPQFAKKRTSEENKEISQVETNPSEAQKEAGNYRKAHIKREGMDVSIENPAGSMRSGTDRNGKRWSQEMKADYGYIKGTKGADAYRAKDGTDQLDVFIKPGSEEGKSVYIVNQLAPDGSFDEAKIMIGYDNAEEAKKAYLSNYEKGWKGLGSIHEMPIEEFKKWAFTEDTKKEYTPNAGKDQTKTEAFKKWFGDSKAVDENGNPLVVFHGTPDARFIKDDGIFKSQYERYGMGRSTGVHWFAKDRAVAKSYADDTRAFDYQNAVPEVIDGYLKLENPLVIDAEGKKWRDAQRRGRTSDVIEEAQKNGNDGVIIKNVRDFYNNNERSKPTTTYAVFSSNQIKSATGNTGEFNAENPDIRFAKKGEQSERPSEYTKEETFGSPQEERLVTAIYRSVGKSPVAGAIKIVEGGPIHKKLAELIKSVTGKDVVWIAQNTKRLMKDIGFAVDGVSFTRAISPELADTIFIDSNTQRPILWTAFHEFAHFIQNSKKLTDAFWGAAKLTDTGKAAMEAETPNEFMADIIGEVMSEEKFWKELSKDQTTFRRFVAGIQNILKQVSDSIRKLIEGKKGKSTYEDYLTDIEGTRVAIADIMRQYTGNRDYNVAENMAAAVRTNRIMEDEQYEFDPSKEELSGEDAIYKIHELIKKDLFGDGVIRSMEDNKKYDDVAMVANGYISRYRGIEAIERLNHDTNQLMNDLLLTDDEYVKRSINNRIKENMIALKAFEAVLPYKKQDIRFAEKEKVDPFYSPLLKAVQSLKQEKGTGEQFFNMLIKTPGVKEAEWKWIGLDDFLKGKKTVTRQEIEDFIRENQVQVEEVEKGEQENKKAVDDWLLNADAEVREEDGEWIASYDGSDIQKKYDSADDAWNALREEAKSQVEEYEGVKPDTTKYSEYTLPGGENYREVLLTLPEKLLPKKELTIEQASDFITNRGAVEVQKDGKFVKNVMSEFGLTEFRGGGYKFYEYGEWKPQVKGKFKSSHWDEPNVIAHIRMNDREVDGEKVLFIEEIQSDWAREARDKGIKPEVKIDDIKVRYFPREEGQDPSIYPGYWESYLPDGTMITRHGGRMGEDAVKKEAFEAIPQLGGVPAQPFLKNWEELTLKRILRLAAEEGYDRVAWINGKQTADRYDLSHYLDRVVVEKFKDKADLYAYDKNKKKAFEEIGIPINEERGQKRIAELVGKDLAEKIVADYSDLKGRGQKEYTGVDFEIKPQWAFNLYDKMIPKFYEKYLKRFNSKVERYNISPDESSSDIGGPVFISAKSLGNIGEGLPLIKKVDGGINIISDRSGLPESGSMKGSSANSDDLGNFLDWQTSGNKRFGELPIPIQGVMIGRVRTMINDLEIGKAIVRLIPVDVVNSFGDKKLSPNMLLNDPSMLLKYLTINKDGSIPVATLSAMDAIVRSPAFPITETFFGSSDTMRLPKDFRSTVRTKNFHNIPLSYIVKYISSHTENKDVGDNLSIPITDEMRESVLYEGQPMFARKKDIEKNTGISSPEIMTNEYRAKEYESIRNSLRRKLKYVSPETLDTRANIELQIKKMDEMSAQTVKDAILGYANASNLGTEGYRQIARMVNSYRTAADLRRAVDIIDRKVEKQINSELMNRAVRSVAQTFLHLKRIQGKTRSTLDYEANKLLNEYIRELMPDTTTILNAEGKPIGSTSDPEEVKAILQRNPDYSTRSENETINQLVAKFSGEYGKSIKQGQGSLSDFSREVIDFIDGKSKVVPESVRKPIERIVKTGLARKSNNDLLKVIRDLYAIKKTGRTSQMVKEAQKKIENGFIAAEIASEIKPGKKLTAAELTPDMKKKLKPGFMSKFAYGLMSPEQVIEKATGRKDSAFRKHIYDPMYNAAKEEIKGNEKVGKFLKETYGNEIAKMRKDSYIEVKVQNEDGDIISTPLTVEQAMHWYAYSVNPHQREWLLASINSNREAAEAQLDSVINGLDEKYKDMVRKQWDYYDNYQWQRMNPVYQNEHNTDMPRSTNYMPLSGLGGAKSFVTDDVEMRNMARPATRKDMTISRTDAVKAMKDYNYFDHIIRNMFEAEHYIAFNDAVRNVASIMSNDNLVKKLDQFSPEARSNIEDWINTMATGRVKKQDDGISEAISKAAEIYSAFQLGGKATTWILQTTALPRGLSYVDPKASMKAISDMVTKHKQTTEMVDELSPFMKVRTENWDAAVTDWMQSEKMDRIINEKSFGSAWRKVKDFTMHLIGYFDKKVAATVWYGKYLEVLNKAGNERDAIYEADRIVRETQQGGGLINASKFERGSVYTRVLTQFMSENRKTLQMAYDYTQRLKGMSAKERAAVMAMAFIVPSVVGWFISNGFTPDEPEEILNQSVKNVTSGVPIIGNFLSLVAQRGIDAGVEAVTKEPKDRPWYQVRPNYSPAYTSMFDDIAKLIQTPNVENAVKVATLGVPAGMQLNRAIKAGKIILEEEKAGKLQKEKSISAAKRIKYFFWSDRVVNRDFYYIYEHRTSSNPKMRIKAAKMYSKLSDIEKKQYENFAIRKKIESKQKTQKSKESIQKKYGNM